MKHLTILSLFFLSVLVLLSVNCDSSTEKAVEKAKDSEPRRVESSSEKPKINVLELISGVGRALHMILNQNQSQALISTGREMIASASSVIANVSRGDDSNGREKEDYRKRAEELRVEIAKRSAQLQKIVASAIEVMKDRGDVMVRRILEHLNNRLDQAKTSADKILKEPATSEMAVRTLNTINQGLNTVNSMIQNTLNRVNIRINVDLKKPNVEEAQAVKQN